MIEVSPLRLCLHCNWSKDCWELCNAIGTSYYLSRGRYGLRKRLLHEH